VSRPATRVVALAAVGVTALSIGFVTVGLIAQPTPTADHTRSS
jgi:hypothetical protein